MRRNKQSGWVYICTDMRAVQRPDGDKEGWYKVGSFRLNRSSKLIDNRSCRLGGCPCLTKNLCLSDVKGG